jgi:hypothetical protein
MENFLAEWGLEILFALISAGVVGYFKYQGSKLKKKLNDYETMMNEKTTSDHMDMVEAKLEPIYQELEELRTYIRETQNIEKAHMTLIIASYRFRLIQLCKEFIKQGYMTYAQYEQLTEFYKLYVGLGGNGQAKEFYERAIQLPIHDAENND